MTMKKYGDSEGDLQVLRGRQAAVLAHHMDRTGIYKLSDFEGADREQLLSDLEAARQLDESEAVEAANVDLRRDLERYREEQQNAEPQELPEPPAPVEEAKPVKPAKPKDSGKRRTVKKDEDDSSEPSAKEG